jgi:hypothetical protein
MLSMKTGKTIDTFTENDWKQLFGLYVNINRAHWTGPPYNFIERTLRDKGEYTFGFPSMGTWGSKFKIFIDEHEAIQAEFIMNEELKGIMKKKLQQMHDQFEEQSVKIFS